MAGHQEAFFAEVLPDAQRAARATGLPVSVVLAQWAYETGYGTSKAWRVGNNYAGVSPGGKVATYPDREAGLAAYVSTMLRPTYEAVRSSAASGDSLVVAKALTASPWASGHYNGNGLTSVIDRYGLTRYDNAAQVALAPGIKKSGLGIDDLVDAVPSLPGLGTGVDVFGGLAEALVGPFVDRFREVALIGLFTAAGLTLIVLGAWRTVPPAMRPTADDVKGVAGVPT